MPEIVKPRGHVSTPATFRQARQYLGLSQSALARVMRMGTEGRHTVRRIEAGQKPRGPYQLVMEALLAGWRPRGVKLPIDREPNDA